jgi:DNA-binding beta-propeller fold protein YncE
MMLMRVFQLFLALMTISLLYTLAWIPPVHADGGAPNLAYVSGAQGGVGVIDVQQQAVTKTIKVPGDPASVALSLDGRFLYVTQPGLNQFSIIAAKDGSTICSTHIPGAPTLIAFDANNKILYVAGNGSSIVTKVDPENCAITQRIETSGPVYGIALAATGAAISNNGAEQLWISNLSSISVFASGSGKSLGSVKIPAGPRNLTIPPGGTVYAITQQGSVLAIDLNSFKVQLLVSGGVYGPMDFNEVTGEVFVPDRKNNQLLVLTPMNAGFMIPKEPERVYKLQYAPVSVAITNDGQLGFVAMSGGKVAMYDIPGRQLITTINTGGTPRFIISGLYPPALGTTPAQANSIDLFASIAGYLIVIVLLLIPLFLFIRYSKMRKKISL